LFGGGPVVLLGECVEELVSFYRGLGEDRAKCGGLQVPVVGHGQGRAGTVRIGSFHRDVVAFSDENKTEPFEGSDDVADRGVDGELGHLCGQFCLSHKGLDHGLSRVNDFGAETLDVEPDGRTNVGKGGVVSVALADDDALEAERIGYVAVRVLLDDHFQLSCHGNLPGA